MRIKRLLLIPLLVLPCIGLAAETGTALKDDQVRAEPYSDAKISGAIARNERVEILSKKGAWLNIKTRKTTGWVRLLSVKRGVSTASGTNASDVLNLASGRAGTGKVVATTGVRGLNEEDLKSAKFNETEIKILEGYEQSASQGRKFANAGGLKAAKFAYLSAPAAASASSTTQTGSPLPGGAR